MKRSVVLIASILTIAAIGTAGGFFYYSSIQNSNSLNILDFTISSSSVEQSNSSSLHFKVLASSTGLANYTIFMSNTSANITLQSGSFLGLLNITNGTILFYNLKNVFPGTYRIGVDIKSNNEQTDQNEFFSMIPHVSFASISGPLNVSDANGQSQATYVATGVSGGYQPYYYNWTVNTSYSGNIQNYSETNSNQSSDFTILFYKSYPTGYPVGPSATYYISLNLTDSNGFHYTISAFEIQVTS